jgi:hypothetical protein
MKIKQMRLFILLVCMMELALFLNTHAQTTLPDALQLDLKRVDEAWRILDQYAGQAWPGWKNNTDIPFRIDYPNGICLYIGKPNPIGKRQMFDSTRMKLVDTTSLRGKKIYLDESRKNSIMITGRLAPGGGGAGLGKQFPDMNIQRSLISEKSEKWADSIWKVLGNPPRPKEMPFSTDAQIVILVHELFHCYANFGPGYSPEMLFNADLNYAVFSEIEGELIEKAANESDLAKTKELLRQFLSARDMKRRGMSEEQRIFESDQEKCEGTATYVAHRIVKLLKNGYEQSLSSKEDPLYFGFRYCDYFFATDLDMFHKVRKSTLQTGGKAYGTGFFICLVLDKLMPEWKTGLFENKVSMDHLLAQAADAATHDTTGMLESLKKDYHFAELVQRHAPVIGSRDTILNLFTDPQLKSFAINYGKMSPMPSPMITSTGAIYGNGMQTYFASGTASIRLGDMSCECNGIPFCKDIPLQSVILPDLEAQTDPFHYEIKFASQEAEQIYRDVTITGKYFTLHAPKIKIVKTPTQLQFTVFPVKQ